MTSTHPIQMDTTTVPSITQGRLRKTSSKIGPNGERYQSEYSQILKKIQAAGLLKRTPMFYIIRFAIVCTLFGGIWTGLSFLTLGGFTWWTLLLGIVGAVGLGLLCAQFGFIGHEAAHRQVFNNNKLNDWAGLIVANLFAGLSYGFWMKKHNKHHAYPNQINVDPDLDLPVISATVEQRDGQNPLFRLVARVQGILYPALLMGTGFHLLTDSFAFFKDKKRRNAKGYLELSLMTFRQLAPLVMFIVLFGWMGVAYWGIFQVVFGLMLGGSFSVNHIGMWLLEERNFMSFFHRQVMASRNIRPSWLADNVMGGLNYQIEHHLFPSMSRPQLKKARVIVREFCAEQGVEYHERGFWQGQVDVMRYLNKVGLSKKTDPFVCPIVSEYRPTV